MKLNWVYRLLLVSFYFASIFEANQMRDDLLNSIENSVYNYTQVKYAENFNYEPNVYRMSNSNWSVLQSRLKTARKNTGTLMLDASRLYGPGSGNADIHNEKEVSSLNIKLKDNDTPGPLNPSQPAQAFTLDTLNGPIKFPSECLPNNSNTPIIFHAFNNYSGFLESLWTDPSSLRSLIVNSPDNTRYVFMSFGENGYSDAVWMRGQIKSAIWNMMDVIKFHRISDLLSRMHFVSSSVFELGNWIPTLLNDWACTGHGCGLPQAKFTNIGSLSSQPIILKRLDGRYDWLSSPYMVFQDKAVRVVLSTDGCGKDPHVAGAIAVIADGNCDIYDKMGFMQKSEAIGVIIYAKSGQPLRDMNCEGDECNQQPPSIPGTMIPYSYELIQMLKTASVNVTFQNTSTSNFYFAIDGQGLLAEMGWLLYPSFQFFVWQAEWFNYKTLLQGNLSQEALVLPVINASIMVGETGIVTTVKLPQITDVLRYKKVMLDTSLSCPGTKDATCPPWDHIMSLYVCCDTTSPLCGMELGRWITSFRRRVGRWLTNITPLLPLFTNETCTLTMKLDAFWAEPWKPSLNIRFSDYTNMPGAEDIQPYQIIPLFQGGTFNKSYNLNYKPINFTLPAEAMKVEIVAVITGHGSDENGCGEFCVTSHHFIVNSEHENVKTFSKAGTSLGCADGTPITGVEPNEHGTWLYGRNGWCNGREVDPWVIDITSQVSRNTPNHVTYFGFYNGSDPDPKSQPGYIVMYSYLVYYRSY